MQTKPERNVTYSGWVAVHSAVRFPYILKLFVNIFFFFLAGLNEGREEKKKKPLCDLRSDEFQLEAGEAAADDMRRSLSLFIGAAVVSSTLSVCQQHIHTQKGCCAKL